MADQHGPDLWDQLLDDVGVFGAYTSLGNYPDEEFVLLAQAAAAALGTDIGGVERWLGESAMGMLPSLYPEFFEPHSRTVPFVLSLNEIIHPEVRKLYPGAIVPDFIFESVTITRLQMRYNSPRKMCSFAEGLVAGAATHFGERALISQPSCMKDGAENCLIECTFETL